MTDPHKLAEEHWKFIGGLLTVAMGDGTDLELMEYVYKTAFEHGWKHAKEDSK